jgi:heme exporter protein C
MGAMESQQLMNAPRFPRGGVLRGPRGEALAWVDFLDPQRVYDFAGYIQAWPARLAIVFLILGFAFSLVLGMHGVAQLGMLHLPAIWLSVLLMVVVVFWSVVGLVLGRPLPFLMAQAAAPTGGMFTFLALWSGALWARAVEGTWWIGDARQIAELALFVLNLLILALPTLLSVEQRVDRAVSVVAVAGSALVAVVFFLVDGWQRFDAVAVPGLLADPRLLWPMILVGTGLWFYATYVALMRLRCLIKEREFGLSELFAARW